MASKLRKQEVIAMVLSIRTIKDVGIFKDFKWDRINNILREF